MHDFVTVEGVLWQSLGIGQAIRRALRSLRRGFDAGANRTAQFGQPTIKGAYPA